MPGFTQSFSKLPVPGVKAQSWYLAPKGELVRSAAGTSAAGMDVAAAA